MLETLVGKIITKQSASINNYFLLYALENSKLVYYLYLH